MNSITIEDFEKNLNIPTELMKEGLLFIWVEKQIIAKVIRIFENHRFVHVETASYIMVN